MLICKPIIRARGTDPPPIGRLIRLIPCSACLRLCCPTGSSRIHPRSPIPGAPHFHITVRLIRATRRGGGSVQTPVMKFGRCPTRVTPSKSETSLSARAEIVRSAGSVRRASRFPPSPDRWREFAARGGSKEEIKAILPHPLLLSSVFSRYPARFFFPNSAETRNTFNYF